jgi:hypothetical protein
MLILVEKTTIIKLYQYWCWALFKLIKCVHTFCLNQRLLYNIYIYIYNRLWCVDLINVYRKRSIGIPELCIELKETSSFKKHLIATLSFMLLLKQSSGECRSKMLDYMASSLINKFIVSTLYFIVVLFHGWIKILFIC